MWQNEKAAEYVYVVVDNKILTYVKNIVKIMFIGPCIILIVE